MTEDRAEQAFRDAFAQHADGLVAARLPAVRRRRRWPVVAAVVAVLALVGGAGIVAALHEGPAPRTANEPVPGPQETDALPAAPDGWRWVTWRDVAVQVPAAWRDGDEPGDDWCANRSSLPVYDAGPYVSRANSSFTFLIACNPQDPALEVFGPAPLQMMQPHLSLAGPGLLPDGETSHRGWTASLRTVGAAQVRLYLDDTDPASAEIARRVHASTRTFTTDDHGCDATSPVQAEQPVRPVDAFDVAAVDEVDSISVCQYDRLRGLDAPALMGSRRVEGSEADALLAAITTAPVGGGPDRPDNCMEDVHGDDALVVRLHHEGTTDDLHVYYDSCRDNGYDDGTSRRELTAGNCSALFAGPVVAHGYQSVLHRRCGRR